MTWGLALLFLAGASAKLLRLDFEVAIFARYELPLWLMTVVGFAELFGALLLLWPRTTPLGAIIGFAVMFVAIPTHLVAGEYHLAPFSLAVMLGLATVGWHRRAALAAIISDDHREEGA